MSIATWSHDLRQRRFVRLTAADLVPGENLEKEWKPFADSWHRLPVDAFMAHGETYRQRRHTVLDVWSDGRVERLPARPYLQTEEINHLNGGVRRTYEDIEPHVLESGLFQGLLTGITSILSELHGPGVWHHQCFQNRITATPETSGHPTPEGLHRDGVDYVVTLLVARDGVAGGRSGIYDAVSRTQIHGETLLDPGDLLLADDERTLHDATPITPTEGRPGHRDVFIDVVTRGRAPR
ncbi:2OG-Fe dioxygenase family protein [Streptomyces sp. YIM 103828]|uniref:2OG-Fe dioxygenase family protein n=1 Tax=Streptomyces TaxID=1883 RepID=UPI0032D8E37E